MSAFLLVEVMVEDSAQYQRCMERVPRVNEKYKGRYVVRGSKVTPNTGGWAPERMILVKFDNLAELQAYFRSPEYAESGSLRESSTATRSIVIED